MVEKGEDPLIAGLRELQEETGYVGDTPQLLGVVRPNAAILSNRCHVILVRNAQKKAQIKFDQHEELVTELYPVYDLKEMVKKGELGKIIKVVCEYPQGYAITALTGEEKAIANWRANPEIAGISNCMGDIGTHAENLVHYITGLEIDRLCADLSVNIPNRKLDDDGNVLVRFKGGARGIIYASQVSNGDENDLNIRVYGTKKSIEWHQEEPNDLLVKDARAPRQVWRRGNGYISGAAAENTRIPFGHPEGFIEAFANVYNAASVAISDEIAGKYPRKSGYDYPDIRDGIIGMAFIETVVRSSKSKEKWIKFPSIPK